MSKIEKPKPWTQIEIVIPIYKKSFTEEEQFAIDRTFQILGCYPIIFFGPSGLNVDYYHGRYSHAKFKFFDANFFESVRGYSRLLVSSEFYRAFDTSEFILIVQPDVYVFKDELNIWLAKNYDYLAAPWPNGITVKLNFGKFAAPGRDTTFTVYVGNGGFSLRNVRSCLNLIEEHIEIVNWFSQTGSNEDLFFSIMGELSFDFKIPNLITASNFAMELEPERLWLLNGNRLPMGAHAYNQYSPEFWNRFIVR